MDSNQQFSQEAGWRLRTLLRTQRFYDRRSTVKLYKSHVLSFVEGGTPALYHACPSILRPLDAIQETLLQEIGLTDAEALLDFNLAPLPMRRDIAMLGLLYKVSRGMAPMAIQKQFSLNPCNLRSSCFVPSVSRHQYHP